MALLDFLRSPGLLNGMLEYGGPGGYDRLTPEAEARLAQEAREAAAKAFAARNGRGAGMGTADMSLFTDQPQPQETLTQQMMRLSAGPSDGFSQQPSPQNVGGPGMQSAPAMPPPINVPSLKVAGVEDDQLPPGARPTQGGPVPGVNFPPQQQQQQPMQPQPQFQPPQQQGGGFGQHLNAGFGSFAGAPTLGGALLGGLAGLITGQRNDPYGIGQQNQQITAKAIYDGLIANGMDQRQAMGIAMAAATNPEVAKAILPQALGPKEPPKTMEEVYARQEYDRMRRGGGVAQAGTSQQASGAPSSYQDWLRQKHAAEAQGKAQGEVAATLPASLQRGQDALTQIDEALKHPGFDRIFGLVGAFPNMPGSNAAGAQARLNQIKGQAFLDAFNMLKGGGAITEVEGAKATAAKARLEAAQSPQEARIALQDFAAAVRTGMQKLRETAGQAPMSPPVNNGGWSNVAPGVRIRERQ